MRRGQRIAAAIVVAATLAGGAARLGTVSWGLPFNFHVDEKGFVVWEALGSEWRGLTRGDFRPRINTYGPLVFEIVIATKWAAMGGRQHAERVARRYDDVGDYLDGAFGHGGEESFHWPQLFRLLRTIAAIVGTAAIALLALAAWTLQGPAAGAATAVLAACSVGLIQVGHFYTPEALLVFEVAMLLHASALLARGRGALAGLYAGAALGLIAATKMPGLLVAPVVPVAIAAADGATPTGGGRLVRAIRKLGRAIVARPCLLALGAAALLYGVLNPWLLFSPDAYLQGVPPNRSGLAMLRTQLTETEFGFYDWRFHYNGTTPVLYYLSHVLPYALGTPALLAAAVALIRGARRPRPIDAIVLVATVPTLLLVGGWGVKTIRYVLPMVPGLVLAGGDLLGRWATAPAAGRRRAAYACRVVACVVLGYSGSYGLAFTRIFAEPDPRIQAARWVTDHARAGDVVVVDPEASYTAPLGNDFERVGVHPELRPPVRVRRLWRARPGAQELPGYLDRMLSDARFLVVSDFYLRRGLHPEAPARAPHHHAFYRALRSGKTGFARVATFRPVPRLGPLRWPEQRAEILSVAFDHVGLEVYERRRPFHNPLASEGKLASGVRQP